MSELFKIVTPSYKRAGEVKSHLVFGDKLIIACHEFEAEKYEKSYKNKLLVIPDQVSGNMGRVRNYILDNIDCKKIVMVDDDISRVGYFENAARYELGKSKIQRFIKNGFGMAEALSIKLWGINLQDDLKFYREYNPISFLLPVLGTFSCIIKSGIRYDERLGLNEDYDFFLQNIHKHKKVLRFNKYNYTAGHLDEKGGCGAYRLLKEEKSKLT